MNINHGQIRALVVAAHADDEAIGCGGLIARLVAGGHIVRAVYMTDGVGSRKDESDAGSVARRVACEEAIRCLGISGADAFDFPDNKMDTVPLLDVVQSLERVLRDFQPEMVLTHHFGDLNVDHRITHQAVMTACRPVPDSSVREIQTFEVLSSTEWMASQDRPFQPNLYVDITDYWEAKEAALRAYEIEMRAPPHSRSIDHIDYLARHRGHSIGVQRAEAFMTARSILR